MGLEVAQFGNRGMYKDTSISKSSDQFAYHNENIRITCTGEETTLSVTNEKEPVKKDIVVLPNGTTITGEYIGHCVTSDYIVLFTSDSTKDHIYRIEEDWANNRYIAKELFVGNIGLSTEHPIETLFYYESQDVQKVYWIDGEHQTRVINIKKEDYIADGNDQFDFVPNVDTIPTVTIDKSFNAVGNFHSGTTQYFITYYNKYGAETNIVWASSLHYIAPENRGGAPDEFVACSFNIQISNIDAKFDYLKLYSAKRQSLDGPLEVCTVADVPVKGKTSISIIDTGANQEAIDSNFLYYIGGSNFIPGTFAQKDDTLFFGNITLNDSEVSSDLKTYIKNNWIDDDGNDEHIKDATRIEFTKKNVPDSEPNGFYPFKQQINISSLDFKTFKAREIYRFAIQYKEKDGHWTTPIWIGDKKCEIYPSRNNDTNEFVVANVEFETDDSNTYLNLTSKYNGYRILMANTDNTTRSIVAQGVVCPTIFNYDQRIHNRPYSISSYIMRPRGGNAEYRHFYPVQEIFGNTGAMLPINISDSSSLYPTADQNIHVHSELNVYNTFSFGYWGYETYLRLYVYLEDVNTHIKTDEIPVFSACGKSDYACNKAYRKLMNSVKSKLAGRYDETYLSRQEHDDMHLSGGSTIGDWNKTASYDLGLHRIYERDDEVFSSDPAYILYRDIVTNNGTVISESYNDEYYVDESIITFNSPELLNISNQVNQSGLHLRLVGVAPITANKSDFRIEFTPESRAVHHKGELLSIPDGYNIKNISVGAITLLQDFLYKGFINDLSHTSKYNIYLWHKTGSIPGLSDSVNGTDVNIDVIDNKTFSTERFSISTEYFELESDPNWDDADEYNLTISTPVVFDYDNVALEKISIPYDEGTYYGNYKNAISPDGDGVYIEHENGDENNSVKTTDPTYITFNSKPHIALSLLNPEEYKMYLLPKLLSDENYDDYLNYSFIWNDQDSLSYNDLINNNSFKKLTCFGIVYSNSYDESQIVNRVENYCNDNMDEYVVGDVNCILITSDDPLNSANPRIRRCYKINADETDPAHPEYLSCELIDDIENYITKIVYTGYYHLVKKKKTVGGVEKYIWYGISSYDSILKDMTSYDYKVYERYPVISHKCSYPYLFIGELYRDIPYSSLYGGHTENAIENIKWIPISDFVPLNEHVTKSEGDTYYQRWDCVKTTPQSLSDINQVIDITSVMIESHICLDGRYDRNRGSGDIININDNNFNLLNDIYSQKNDIFSYNILDEKYDLDKFSNQILWSNQKTPISDVDTWTNVSQLSSIYLNGEYGPINKLVNFNDTIVAFQDRAIAAVNFNNNIQVSTEQGLPIEVVNSGKVTGYNYISTMNGCHNKWSIHQSSGGLYFIDDYNKALFKFNKDGLSNLSLSCGFAKWFNDNVSGNKWILHSDAFRISSDKIKHDIYITSDQKNVCLCYNEDLQSFTSFYPSYYDAISVFNLKNKTLFLNDSLDIYNMFDGDYNREFFVEYKINPEPLIEKTFTNIEYIADTVNNEKKLLTKNPFSTLNVETEYQSGTTNLLQNTYPNGSEKFRVWRADIPRDKNNKLDRIRNPWIKLKLTGNPSIEGITTLHSLVVKYFK